LIISNLDGSNGALDPDLLDRETFDTKGDIRDPNRISGKYDPNRVGDDVRSMRDGYMGDMLNHGIENPLDKIPGPGSKYDLGDPLGGRHSGRPDPGRGEIPGQGGIFPERDLLGLRGSATFGADPRVGTALEDLEDETDYQNNLKQLGRPSDNVPNLGDAIREEAKGYGDTDFARMMNLVGKLVNGEELTPDESEWLEDYARITADQEGVDREKKKPAKDEKGGAGGGGKPPTGTSTPNPERGDEPAPYHEKYKSPPKTSENPLPIGYDPTANPVGSEGLMQPPDQEGNRADRPMKPITLEQAMAGNLDPYINWGDDQDGGLSSGSVTPDILNAGGNLIDGDPPKPVSGTEGSAKKAPS
jgi:hypothetical protein